MIFIIIALFLQKNRIHSNSRLNNRTRSMNIEDFLLVFKDSAVIILAVFVVKEIVSLCLQLYFQCLDLVR